MEGETKINYCVCGVPHHLHGTCCGWTNAVRILHPQNALEAFWAIMARDAWSDNSTTVSLGISYNSMGTVGCTCNQYATVGHPAQFCPMHYPVFGMSYSSAIKNNEP